jgi:IclR family transcriptional regulator, pca regulon regulatory protein
VLDGGEIVYVARSAPKRVMTIDLNVGSRLPAYCTSMGRVLLAAMPQEEISGYLTRDSFPALTAKTITDHAQLRAILDVVRTQGYALVDEELELGLRSIAVPVVTRSARVVAAMNSGVSAARVLTSELLERILPALREHALRLGQKLA